jgi:hypothetical protein
MTHEEYNRKLEQLKYEFEDKKRDLDAAYALQFIKYDVGSILKIQMTNDSPDEYIVIKKIHVFPGADTYPTPSFTGCLVRSENDYEIEDVRKLRTVSLKEIKGEMKNIDGKWKLQ